MRSKRSACRELARWAVATDSIPEEAHHAARRVLMDQVGVSLAGGKALDRLSKGEPQATSWATGESLYAPDAALQNRFAGDDLELTAGPELGAAAVAAAEIADRTFGELYVAMAVGAEIEQYARSWLQTPVERHGLHPPAVFGALAAAATSAKLLDLDEDRFTETLAAAMALAPASPYVAFSHGATGKWLYGAFSQRLGVQCALWAEAGIGGAESTLEGARGIAQAFLHERAEAPSFEPNGWAIARVTHKAFRCSRACHPALTALETLGPVDGGTVASVEIWSYPFSVELEKRSTKDNAIADQMSVSRMVSRALGAEVPIEVYALGRDTLPRERKARVRLSMKDGSVREATSGAKWDSDEPATDDEIRARFLEMSGGGKGFDPWLAPDGARVRERVRRG